VSGETAVAGGGPRLAIVDYGMGNRRSVEKAFARVGAEPVITRDPGALRAADGVVVPGVGAFPQAMRNLRELGLDELLRERVEAGVPVLGICLGMQLLFERSVEREGDRGLGFLPGAVERLDADGWKLPHIGWNVVRLRRRSAITEELPDEAAFYHVHTYAPVPAREDLVVGVSDYGGPFVSVVADPERPLFGVQFHPEKSSAHGLALLAGFARVCGRVAAR
jgi:imidazole glycerol-phosphate synthase subunit HisH